MMFVCGGCAVNPLASQSRAKHSAVAERDVLANAALAVETSPWPRPESVSLVSRLTGAAQEDRVSRSDAVAQYVNALQPAGDRFSKLAADARANLQAADHLLRAADYALAAPRVTNNDVAVLEAAIQTLRENRQIYVSAADKIKDSGEAIDSDQLQAIRADYALAIREIGRSADALAGRIDHDQSENYATPAKPRARRNFSGV
jgi:hypothetical protein